MTHSSDESSLLHYSEELALCSATAHSLTVTTETFILMWTQQSRNEKPWFSACPEIRDEKGAQSLTCHFGFGKSEHVLQVLSV